MARNPIGLALAGMGLALALAGCGAPEPAQNLVFVSMDTTRADHLSLYGYERPTTPFLDGFFADGAVFENAITPFNTTVPTHTTMLTGVYPHTHGNRRGTGFDESFRTLTEILDDEGFRSGAFIGGYPLKARSCRLDRGFEVYSARFKGNRRDAELVIDRALQWLTTLEPDDRYFLFVHFYDSHGPYRENKYLEAFRSPDAGPELSFVPGYQRRRDKDGTVLRGLNHYIDRYDAQIRHQDEQLERLLGAVDTDRTLVVLTADHGETLADRAPAWNLNHGHNVFQEQIAVPLAIRGPRVNRGRLEALAESVDLLPTILDLLDVEAESTLWEGASLAPILTGGEAEDADIGFASSDPRIKTWAAAGYELDPGRSIQTVLSRRWKLIRYPGLEDDYLELYRLDRDPGEQTNLAAQHPEVAERMLAALDRWSAGAGSPDTRPDDSGLDRDALRALGYIE